MEIIDTHAHLDYPDFDEDRPALFQRAEEAGVKEMISIGTRPDSSEKALELAENFPQIWAALGVHPCDAEEWSPQAGDRFRSLAESSRVVALGEIGLDYHHLPSTLPVSSISDEAYKKRQEIAFREQLDLAVSLSLNVVIHQRDSWTDTLKILKEYQGKVRGVFHCFGGGPIEAQELIRCGHLISITGIVTFKNAPLVHATAKEISLEHLMVETDCPYLAPVPFRGKRCEPAHTRLVADCIAKLKGISVEEVAKETTATARKFFRFPTL